nr:MAG: RNA-dependent RNA polymerase [Riboviria sp.]
MTRWHLSGAQDLNIHEDCLCNQLRSARNRVLQRLPQPSDAGAERLLTAALRLAKQVGRTAPLETDDQIVASFPPCRRRKYREVLTDLRGRPFKDTDAFLNAFVKCEKIPIVESNKDPRMIQARSCRYNATVARYLKPLEHRLYLIQNHGLRCVAKGMNERQRARSLKRMWDKRENPVALSLDQSRWDAHCSKAFLTAEHKVYSQCCPDARFARLMRMQLRNRVYTRHGLVYQCEARRMSGDMNTALGNCLGCVLTIRIVLERLGMRSRADFLVDGDDHVIVIEEDDLQHFLAGYAQEYLQLGFEVTCDGVARRFGDITFCQSKPVYHHGTWEMMPRLSKVLSGAFVVPGNRTPCTRETHTECSLECEVAYCQERWAMRALLHQGQPVLGPLFYRLCGGKLPRHKFHPSHGVEVRFRVDQRPAFVWTDVEAESMVEYCRQNDIPIDAGYDAELAEISFGQPGIRQITTYDNQVVSTVL